MKTNYPAAILSNFDGDYRAAYEHLSKMYLALERQFYASVSSRFIEVGRFESEDPIYCHKITEDQISRAVDMADCQDAGVMRQWFYVGDNGEFLPVTIGKQSRYSDGVEQPFYFASSAIVAGGECVGEVAYTDH